MISGNTKVYSVIGNPVKHSKSPNMHNAAFQALNINACYVPLEPRNEDLKKISDHWKEKVILRYSAEMLLSSLKILLIIFFISIFFILLHLLNNEFKTFIFSLIGSMELTFIAFIYYYIRKKLID